MSGKVWDPPSQGLVRSRGSRHNLLPFPSPFSPRLLRFSPHSCPELPVPQVPPLLVRFLWQPPSSWAQSGERARAGVRLRGSRQAPDGSGFTSTFPL